MAEFGADHDRDFTDLNFVILVQSLLRNDGSHTIFIGVSSLQLFDFDSNINLSLVSQITKTSLVCKNGFINAIFFKISWKLVNSDIAKVDAIDCVFIILATKLTLLHNVLGPEFFNDLLDGVLEEAFK